MNKRHSIFILGALAALVAILCGSQEAAAAVFLLPMVGTATTTAIEAPEMPGNFRSLPVAAATSIPAGAMVARDSSGNAVNAADTAGLTVVGRAEHDADNTDGDAGDIVVQVKLGIFGYTNSGSAAVDADDIGKPCYVEDNATVAESSTYSVVAGIVHAIENGLVYVDTRNNHFAPQVTLGNANGEISGLTISSSYSEAEIEALQTKCEELADDVRAIHAALVGKGLLRA